MATQSAFTWRWSSSEAADAQAQSKFENEKFECNCNEADNGSDGRKERRGILLFDSQCVTAVSKECTAGILRLSCNTDVPRPGQKLHLAVFYRKMNDPYRTTLSPQ